MIAASSVSALSWHGLPPLTASSVRRSVSPPKAVLDDPSFLSSLSGLTHSLAEAIDADAYLSSLAYAASATAEAATRTATAITSLDPQFPTDLAPILEARQMELKQQLEIIEQLIKQTQPPKFPFDLPDALAARDLAGPLLAAVGLAASKTLDWRGSISTSNMPTTPYPTGRYDPVASRAYYAARPLQVLQRVLSSAVPASGFGLSLLIDYLRGPDALAANARVRAEQLVTALNAMGPTYIKVKLLLLLRRRRPTAALLPPYCRPTSSLPALYQHSTCTLPAPNRRCSTHNAHCGREEVTHTGR